MTAQVEALRLVRDWRALRKWARDFEVPIESRATHQRLLVGGRIITISESSSDRRAVLNARSDIRRALEAVN